MSLGDLMRSFERLPGAEVGDGPADLADEVEEFLGEHPALAQDPGYVEFLRRYSGAGIDDHAHDVFVDILGFSDGATRLEDLEAPPVDEDGFLIFAMAVYDGDEAKGEPRTIQYTYAFDTTGERAPGVYRYDALTGRSSVPYRLVAPDFTAWLGEVVARRGALRDG